MKKSRPQTAFATLTEAETEQLADWLCHHTATLAASADRTPARLPPSAPPNKRARPTEHCSNYPLKSPVKPHYPLTKFL